MDNYNVITALTWMALGVLCVLVHENDRTPKWVKTDLYLAYALIALSSAAEWFGVLLNGREGLPAWPLMLAKCADYIFTPLAGGILARQLGVNRRAKILRGILIFNTIFQLVSLPLGWVVSVDANNNYIHGPLYLVYVAVYLAIFAIVALQCVEYGRSFRRENRASLYAIMALIATGIAAQEILGGEVRTAYISLALGVALLYIHNAEFSQLEQDESIARQRAQIMTDALTGVRSRHAYALALEQNAQAEDVSKDLAVFALDLNGLKEVNDALGHDAGDELIRAAATCTRTAFGGEGVCYRTGGDEFVVLAHMGQTRVREVLHDLRRITEGWKGEAVDSLSISAGYALAAEHQNLGLCELVATADRYMYAAKEAYYRQPKFDRRRR